MFSPKLSFPSVLSIDFGKILEFNTDFYDILTSTYVTELQSLPVAGVYRVTTERFRPDLISAKIYNGQEQYKHILMLYNNIISYKQIISGLDIIYPSVTDLESLLFGQSLKLL